MTSGCRTPVAVAAAALLAGSAAWAGPATPARPDNVLLITIDTLRPDALGWVAGTNDTPAIDALAAGGFRFPSAVAEVPLTLPSHTSMLTGLLPRRHGVRDNGQVVPDGTVTLARILEARGYSTGAFVSGYPLRALFGLGQGFGVYDDVLPVGAEGWVERPAPATAAAALTWVKTARPPWFLWVHFYDPHDPYTPPREFWRPGARGSYDGEVALTDHGIGRLRDELARLDAGGTVTVLAGDHGESLGEHGEPTHGYFIYDSTTLVPLVISRPGIVRPGESQASPRLVDVLPTVLELLGLPVPEAIDGVSLVPTLEGRAQAIPPAYVESRYPWITYGWSPLKAIRSERWKLVVAPRPELYDLRADPAEARNVYGEHREVVVGLAAQLAEVEGRGSARAGRVADPEALASLRSLGYLSAGGGDREPPRGLPDPKDRTAERDACASGEALLRAGRTAEALRVFDGVLAADPGNRFATVRAGIACLKAGDAKGAVPRLRRALAGDPEQAETHYALADALMRLGDDPGATVHWMETIRLQPRRTAAWSNLGIALGRQGRHPDSVKAFRSAAEIDPGDLVLLANLGLAEHRAGDEASALVHLSRAAAAPSFPYPGTLGILLASRGEDERAREWLRRSRPGEPDHAMGRLRLATLEAKAGRTADAAAALADALAADPGLRPRAAKDPVLTPLLQP
jgi:arylsulfatase A-like enzyme/Tfp pilus assembly protein PilF